MIVTDDAGHIDYYVFQHHYANGTSGYDQVRPDDLARYLREIGQCRCDLCSPKPRLVRARSVAEVGEVGEVGDPPPAFREENQRSPFIRTGARVYAGGKSPTSPTGKARNAARSAITFGKKIAAKTPDSAAGMHAGCSRPKHPCFPRISGIDFSGLLCRSAFAV